VERVDLVGGVGETDLGVVVPFDFSGPFELDLDDEIVDFLYDILLLRQFFFHLLKDPLFFLLLFYCKAVLCFSALGLFAFGFSSLGKFLGSFVGSVLLLICQLLDPLTLFLLELFLA
jgi:hypothetical protein